MKSTTVTVTINNYAKYKGRKDVENPSWLKLSNRILEDPDFYHFTHEEILVWVQILARASQKQQETVVLDLTHCERVCRLTPAAVHSAIEKLQALSIISVVTSKKVRRNVDVTPTLRGIEERREEREEGIADVTHPLQTHFQKLCDEYPIKVSKTKTGFERFVKCAKNEIGAEKILLHLARYKKHLQKNPWKEPKQSIETFLGTKKSGFFWEQWASDDVGEMRLQAVPGVKNTDPLHRVVPD